MDNKHSVDDVWEGDEDSPVEQGEKRFAKSFGSFVIWLVGLELWMMLT